MLRDVLRETWPYQNIPQEGHEEELPQQFQQAFLQGLHLTLLKIVRVRFPNVVRLAKKQTAGIEEVAILRDLIVKISITQTAEEAVMYLLEVDEDEDEED